MNEWLPSAPFLVYMHGTCLTFERPFVKKLYCLGIFNCIMEVPIESSEDCYCDLSVPIPNGYTIVTSWILLAIFAVLKLEFLMIRKIGWGHSLINVTGGGAP